MSKSFQNSLQTAPAQCTTTVITETKKGKIILPALKSFHHQLTGKTGIFDEYDNDF